MNIVLNFEFIDFFVFYRQKGDFMPFTIGGDWIPESKPVTPKKPVKVILEKRKKSILTVIMNLSDSPEEMQALASELKKKLGAGGTVKEGRIEIQGDKVDQVMKFLKERSQKKSYNICLVLKPLLIGKRCGSLYSVLFIISRI